MKVAKKVKLRPQRRKGEGEGRHWLQILVGMRSQHLSSQASRHE